jgi:hypothetical protein
MDWLQANWIPVAAVVFAAASEIIGMNPAWKSNSVIQLVLAVIGKFLPVKK